METILFVLQSVLVALLCFMTLKDEQRPRGTPPASLFRYRERLGVRAARPRSFVPGTYRDGATDDLGGRPRR